MRLIDADDLIFYGMTDDISKAQAEDIVANAPTIEVEPKISKLELDGLRDKIGRLNEAIIEVEQDRARMVVRYEELSKRYDTLIDGLLERANQWQEE